MSLTTRGGSVAAVSDAQEAMVHVTVRVAGRVLRIAFSGELDLACSDFFDCLFDLPTQDIDAVVLDLGALTFCDVTGADALRGLRSFHQCHGRRVDVVDVMPHVRRVMAIAEQPVCPSRAGRATS